MQFRCCCPCHRSSILTVFQGVDITDAIEAVTACGSCLHLHCMALMERRVWWTAPDPSPYKDDPPPPVNFCDPGEGAE